MVKKKVGIGIIFLALIGGGIALLLPRVDAQQYPAKQTEMLRWQRDINQKLDSISNDLSNIQKEWGMERFQRELNRKLENLTNELSDIQRKLGRMDRKLDNIKRTAH